MTAAPTVIDQFIPPYRFLSNFSQVFVVLDGVTYTTVEHAYQAAKTLSPERRAPIAEAATPGRAKRLGGLVPLREDWESVKEAIMFDLLRQKFRNPATARQLLATGDALLIEGNHWGDREWGCVWEEGRWVGRNKLGRLLMLVRAELRGEGSCHQAS